jgi:hypothetical protein
MTSDLVFIRLDNVTGQTQKPGAYHSRSTITHVNDHLLNILNDTGDTLPPPKRALIILTIFITLPDPYVLIYQFGLLTCIAIYSYTWQLFAPRFLP